ncbi:MAG: hypothetical protein ACE5IC_10115 [Candidatus Brocadiales bacterium]
MPWQATVYRILISSPSDIDSELKVIREVIHSWNAANSLKYGAILEPVFWQTHATLEMGDRPQATVNKQLVDSCDVLIGIFKTRISAPKGRAESCTVEEVEEFRKAGKRVLLYFSLVPVGPGNIDATQYQRLVEFKKKSEKEGLVVEYDSISSFQEQLQKHITWTVNSIHKVSGAGSQKAVERQ